MHSNPFTDAELVRRLAATRTEMAKRGLDMALFSSPENIFYLIGLDHWGYFAPHLLLVPAEGDLTLITRQMEQVVIRNQVRNATFIGHTDSETAADVAVKHLNGQCAGAKPSASKNGPPASPTAWATNSPPRSTPGNGKTSPACSTSCASSNRPRKSPSCAPPPSAADAGTQAAIDAIHDGARETDVAADCLAAMTRAGGTPPGFGPFIRPAARMAEEHTSWGDGTHHQTVFLEVAGCVARYNAPMGRLVHIGYISEEDAAMAELSPPAPSTPRSTPSSPA